MDTIQRAGARLLAVIEELRKIDTELPAQHAAALAVVAAEPGLVACRICSVVT
jgi:hypothetical protein